MTKEEQAAFVKETTTNQKEIIGRLKNIEKQLNQIIPKPRTYAPVIPDDLMGYIEAAKYIGMGSSQFNRRAKDGEIPFKYYDGKAGRQYSKVELNEWIIARPNK